jgi:predicted CXXCH cytochrome family protein
VNCSPRNGNAILQFFFDGVPDQNAKAASDQPIMHANVQLSDTLNRSAVVISIQDNDSLFYHKPFKEKDCNSCHNNETPGSLSHSQTRVCYSCHQNWGEKYKRVHGPVAAGECTACHEPHASSNKNLLRRDAQNLCVYCHETGLIMKNKAHQEIGQKECTECHYPHGGKDRFMLK